MCTLQLKQWLHSQTSHSLWVFVPVLGPYENNVGFKVFLLKRVTLQ